MASFVRRSLTRRRPARLAEVVLPRRVHTHPSPRDWRDEVLYFLLVDRFSDGRDTERPLLDRSRLADARPDLAGEPWRWDRWAESGAARWQGGTLAGVASKLGYLKHLGVTALWISPVFKQRGHLDTYHGYGIQDFLEVDPHFGSRRDLVQLVSNAHDAGLRVILDVIFNHSGENWVYGDGLAGGPHTPVYTSDRHAFGSWLDRDGSAAPSIDGPDDGVWPIELQDPDFYTRAGSGSLGAGSIDDAAAEHKRTDFITLRDFRLDAPPVLSQLAQVYKYWIALTDCDGFRIDTLKHVSLEQARNFCGSIKEFAANLGKHDFFLVGEVAGGDLGQDRYLDVLERNLNAALDIGEMRLALRSAAKGLSAPDTYFAGFDPGRAVMGSHRNLGTRHVSVLDDHDHVFGEKTRFSSDASSEHQAFAGVALQLLTLGIPCLYYGTEQALAGPEPHERRWLPEWGRSDRYLREAMFGPEHPRKSGRPGLRRGRAALDPVLPGFGPFGTTGHHVFDESTPLFARIAALTHLRATLPVLRYGRQYLRPTSFLGYPFAHPGPGELLAWSRILDDEEALCVLNPHGTAPRGADIVVDLHLNRPGALHVAYNSAAAPEPAAYAGPHPVGEEVKVRRSPDGASYVEIRDLPPSELLVLINHP